MAKKVAILQSNYIPWRGYFDLIAYVDEFVIYDEVQYTKNDWRNRNRIKTPTGPLWLTAPVRANTQQTIHETRFSDTRFPQKHWKSIVANYGRAAHFESTAEWLEPLYEQTKPDYLSEWNFAFLTEICDRLGIGTKIRWSHDIYSAPGKTERLVGICEALCAGTYVSGPAAKAYLETGKFDAAGISVEWIDYTGYAPYEQLWGEFEPNVSILDLILNCGPASNKHLKHVSGTGQ